MAQWVKCFLKRMRKSTQIYTIHTKVAHHCVYKSSAGGTEGVQETENLAEIMIPASVRDTVSKCYENYWERYVI